MVKSFQHKRCRCNWILWSQQLPVSKQLSSGIKRQKQKGKVQLEVDIFISQMEKREIFFTFPLELLETLFTLMWKTRSSLTEQGWGEQEPVIWGGGGAPAARELESGSQPSTSFPPSSRMHADLVMSILPQFIQSYIMYSSLLLVVI